MVIHTRVTLRANCLVALAPPAPTTLTVNVLDPPTDGVPEMTPAELSVSPVGSVPTVIDHM